MEAIAEPEILAEQSFTAYRQTTNDSASADRPALIADVGGKAHAAVRILVRGRGVNQVGAVNHHVARFVIGDKPNSMPNSRS